MKVSQEKLPDSQIGLEIEVPSEVSQQTYETVVTNLARSTQIPGFRKGKIPRQVLIQRLGAQRIKAAALDEMIQNSLKAAVEQESLETLGNYQLRSDFDELLNNYIPGQPLTFSASVDVPPTVELGNYDNLSIQAEETLYDPQEVEQWLEQQRERFVTLVPIEARPVQMGDVVIIDYQARQVTETGEAGESIPGVSAEDFRVDLEEGKFIEGFIEGIVGMQPAETKQVAVKFPEDYPEENLAGQPVIFEITVKELKEKELPELDDELAEQISENSPEKFETLATLREFLEKQYQEKAANETKNAVHTALLTELTAVSSVDLPETLIQEEVTQVLQQTAVQMQKMGIDLKLLFTQENIPKMRENARPEAIKRLKESLVIRELAKVEGIAVEEMAINQKFNEMRRQLAEEEIDVNKLRQIVTEELTLEKTLDWLQGKATINLVPKGSLQKTSESEEVSESATESAPAMGNE